ncbi:hypothetical protein HK097_002200 [Rhizophlyctis rosea]|uniref:C2 domain-containing protein n=1 Tax=Rhizophlyctis rosea TaxID=64517 RepID=A0AAD5X1D8_9FUNG|nr:hypothetical protein HK097_002200 [Rhizophlyctis rosea]
MSRIEVRLVEGRGLKDQDKVGTNDSYVELYFDEDYKQASSVVSNTNDPQWGETFTFQTGGKHKLYIKALDKDVGDKDKIGEATLDVSPALSGTPIDEWVKLKGSLGLRSHGEVHLVVRAI